MCHSSLGHYILWKAGIQHGDISVSNLMHRNGTGVLNDFDLARLDTPGIRGFDRTGTKPFLALDLLTADAQDGKAERRYRYDLESFLWITACYDNGVASIPANYNRWHHEDIDMCLGAKTVMLHNRNKIHPIITNSYRILSAVTVILRNYWKDFYNQPEEEEGSSTVNHVWMQQNFVESS